MVEILNKSEWFGHTLENIRIYDADSVSVPCTILWPENAAYPCRFVIATHGATSSKHEWTEMDGYTKGGNLSRLLLDAGVALVAMDWHYHGDNDTRNMNGRNVFEEQYFEDFFTRSIADIQAVITYAKQHEKLDENRMGFAGYSLAGMFGIWLSNSGADFKTLLLCVPGANRSSTTPYAIVNNLKNIGERAVLQLSAEQDEYINFDDAKWLFSQIPVKNKIFHSFKSGHSLPIDYVSIAADWLSGEL